MTSAMTAKPLLFAGALLASAAADVVRAEDSGRGRTVGFFVSDLPDGGAEPIAGAPIFTEIQVLSLPPGNYIANASAVLASSDPTFHFVGCMFTIGERRRGELAEGLIGGDFNNFLTLPLTIGFRIEAPRNLGVACTTDVPDIVVSQPSPLTAIRVDRLQVQTHE